MPFDKNDFNAHLNKGSAVYDDSARQDGGSFGGVSRDDGVSAAGTSSGSVVEPTAVGGATGYDGKSLDDALGYLRGRVAYYKGKQEDDVTRARRERSERRLRSVAAVGDLLGAMHRAYSHGRGVSPMSLDDMSERVRSRIERSRAVREGNEDRILRYYERIGALEGAQRAADNAQESLALRRMQEDRLATQHGLSVRKQDWKEKYEAGKLDIEGERLQIERDYKSGLISKMERDAASSELRAQAAMLRAQKVGSGSRGSGRSNGGKDGEGARDRAEDARDRAARHMVEDPKGWQDAIYEALGGYKDITPQNVYLVNSFYEERQKKKQKGGSVPATSAGQRGGGVKAAGAVSSPKKKSTGGIKWK